jgi:hypothetical protein
MMTTIPTDREQLAMSMNDRQTGAYIFEALARTIEELCDPNDGDSSKLVSPIRTWATWGECLVQIQRESLSSRRVCVLIGADEDTADAHWVKRAPITEMAIIALDEEGTSSVTVFDLATLDTVVAELTELKEVCKGVAEKARERQGLREMHAAFSRFEAA